jgi:hypothetical protein
MARIQALHPGDSTSIVRAEYERHLRRFQSQVTNMKGTLVHSMNAFEVYMQWYILYDDMRLILGARLANLFGYAISKASNCMYWTTYFRKFIIDNNENPEELQLKEKEKLVMDFGSAIGANQGIIDQALFDKMSKLFNERKMVDLIAFAGNMVGTCVFANVTETDLDEYLCGYESGADTQM